MKLSYTITNMWATHRYEVRFRQGNYVTHGYGHNRLQARAEVRNRVREHIQKLEDALAEKDEWSLHGQSKLDIEVQNT